MFSLPLKAEETRLDGLYADLSSAAEPKEARRIAREIELAWRSSGSASADLLLKRGRDALKAGDIQSAIGHLTALTDHAPDFAEGWNARATAFAAAELYGPALADIERALALEPRHFNALANLGGILAQSERPAMAKQAFEYALAIHPHHEDVLQAIEKVKHDIGGRDL
ncbi:MAG: tetratricopeptide repeat protein [Rhodobacteraceae bacterium]|jgi:tetratricopeptide (TPR) repeat protein|nr:tetratricopeptide repeat protein [Paracoccaceae bacterium]